MPETNEQLETITSCLRLPWSHGRNIMLLAVGRQPQDESPVKPFEELALAIGSWLAATLRMSPNAAVLLLKEMMPTLREIAPTMLRIWTENDNTVPVPAHELHLAEHRYALWGDKEQFWDTREARYLNPLPSPPIWRTSVHITGLYFAYLRLKDRTDADQTERSQKPAGR